MLWEYDFLVGMSMERKTEKEALPGHLKGSIRVAGHQLIWTLTGINCNLLLGLELCPPGVQVNYTYIVNLTNFSSNYLIFSTNSHSAVSPSVLVLYKAFVPSVCNPDRKYSILQGISAARLLSVQTSIV